MTGFYVNMFFLLVFHSLFLVVARSIPAMVSIATTSPQTRTINQRCGLKPGLAGKFAILLPYWLQVSVSLWERTTSLQRIFSVLLICMLCFSAGLLSLEVLFPTDQLKTWHFQLQGLYRREDHSLIITW